VCILLSPFLEIPETSQRRSWLCCLPALRLIEGFDYCSGFFNFKLIHQDPERGKGPPSAFLHFAGILTSPRLPGVLRLSFHSPGFPACQGPGVCIRYPPSLRGYRSVPDHASRPCYLFLEFRLVHQDQEEEKNPTGFFDIRLVHQGMKVGLLPPFISSGFDNPSEPGGGEEFEGRLHLPSHCRGFFKKPLQPARVLRPSLILGIAFSLVAAVTAGVAGLLIIRLVALSLTLSLLLVSGCNLRRESCYRVAVP